ncbi:type II toxin-antitoxin system VapC family toxin [Candidatus Micrarchaeota archaeon]|nr:type II toxin-antitoxin system VapC family toxin [Candidatus Micrarchaeota archaeon]
MDFETALDFLRGDPATIEKLKYYADREELCVTSLTMLHLLETVNKKEIVMKFANSVTVLPFDKRAAQIASQINKGLMEKGELPKMMESILTAAICMANDAFLFSRSSWKFDGIKGLKRV